MLDRGDEISIKATCLYIGTDRYVFSPEGNSIEWAFEDNALVVHLSPNNQGKNQLIHNALDKLKV
jgi:hypothetical protein